MWCIPRTNDHFTLNKTKWMKYQWVYVCVRLKEMEQKYTHANHHTKLYIIGMKIAEIIKLCVLIAICTDGANTRRLLKNSITCIFSTYSSLNHSFFHVRAFHVMWPFSAASSINLFSIFYIVNYLIAYYGEGNENTIIYVSDRYRKKSGQNEMTVWWHVYLLRV